MNFSLEISTNISQEKKKGSEGLMNCSWVSFCFIKMSFIRVKTFTDFLFGVFHDIL
jgi:hypothetical protein